MEDILTTKRLILRRWEKADAESLYKYASDPDVGTPAGWPPHTSVEMSREVIETVFSAPHTYAIVLKATGEPIGCCGLVPPEAREKQMIAPQEAEIGYWIGRPYWGQGLVPEAITKLIEYTELLGFERLWIAFYESNEKSKRVAEKCGFTYDHTETNGAIKEHFYVR